MKTAERIVYTALSLFNERGENSVTSVDIALELDISPGNLYYHYKGKEAIVDKLLSAHKSQMLRVLRRDLITRLDVMDTFYYLYIVIEKLHAFRFLYRSPADLTEKYPESQKIRRHIVMAIESQFLFLLQQCSDEEVMTISQAELPLVTELLVLILTQTFQFEHFSRPLSDKAQRYHCLSLMLMCLLPRLNVADETVESLKRGIEKHSLANLRSREWAEEEY